MAIFVLYTFKNKNQHQNKHKNPHQNQHKNQHYNNQQRNNQNKNQNNQQSKQNKPYSRNQQNNSDSSDDEPTISKSIKHIRSIDFNLINYDTNTLVIDSGADGHSTNNRDLLTNFKPNKLTNLITVHY